MLLILAVCALIGVVNSSCEICVNRLCHTKKILMKDVHITDQLAIDRTNNILYVQMNSNMNTAIYLQDYAISKMHMVQTLNTSGMAIKQTSQELYTADYNNTVYIITLGSNSTTIPITGLINGVVDLLYYENTLYFTIKGEKNLFFVDETSLGTKDLANFTIIDFVKTKKGIIFVTDYGVVYEYKDPYDKLPEILVNRRMTLGTDKNDDVYLSETSQKVIYKKDNVTDKLIMYAAYSSGSVDKFVFDKFNDIIVYDHTEMSLVYWMKQTLACIIEPPKCTYHIQIDSAPVNHMTVDRPVKNSDSLVKKPSQEYKISKGKYENFAQFWTALN